MQAGHFSGGGHHALALGLRAGPPLGLSGLGPYVLTKWGWLLGTGVKWTSSPCPHLPGPAWHGQMPP